MTVSALLAKKGHGVITIPPDASIASAVSLLKDRRIGAIVVSNDGAKVSGILSERDIVLALDSHGPGLLDDRVSDIMTRLVVTCGEESTVDEVMHLMTNGHFRHVPVLKEEKLTGIISIGDVVKSKLESLQSEAEVLRSYIGAS